MSGVFARRFQSLEVFVDRDVRIDKGIRQEEFLFPWVEFVDSSAIGKDGYDIVVLDGTDVVFAEAGDIKDDLIGPHRSWLEPSLLVLFLKPVNDVHRWIRLGSLSFQPSELAKLAIILFLAYHLERKGDAVNDFLTICAKPA